MPAPNKTRFALLGLLTFGPMSGYDIKKMFEKSLSYFWNESYGQIYPVLKKLAAEGLTRAGRDNAQGKRERTVYTLGEKGAQAFEDWLALPPEPLKERNELLLKLFFGRHSPTAINQNHLQAARDHYAGLLVEYDELESKLRTECEGDPDQPYWLITLSYGQHQSRAMLQWCEQSLAILGGKSSQQPPTEEKSTRHKSAGTRQATEHGP